MATNAKAQAAKASPTAKAKPVRARWSLVEAMTALAEAGTAQNRKIYARHGASEPMFGVSFATLKLLMKQIGVDHALACSLWETGNHDARILAVKVVDPTLMTRSDLDRWARTPSIRLCAAYVACVASETRHALQCAEAWVSSPDEGERTIGWSLVGTLAMRVESVADAWFAHRLAEIERCIASAPNHERGAMNHALIAIGCRSETLRHDVLAAAARIGRVEIDHGDTECKTPVAAAAIAKSWDHAVAKGFASPATQEQQRPSMRLRC